MMSEKKEGKYFCKRTIKTMGFSEKMIKDLLPTPILAKNPHYSSADKMQLWEKEVVAKVMQTDEFKSEFEKAEIKRKQAEKVVEIKKQKLLDYAKQCVESYQIQFVPISQIKREVFILKHKYEDFSIRELSHIKREYLQQWCVEYILDNYTNYRQSYADMCHKVGYENALNYLIEATYDKIAIAYPMLKEKCDEIKELLL